MTDFLGTVTTRREDNRLPRSIPCATSTLLDMCLLEVRPERRKIHAPMEAGGNDESERLRNGIVGPRGGGFVRVGCEMRGLSADCSCKRAVTSHGGGVVVAAARKLRQALSPLHLSIIHSLFSGDDATRGGLDNPSRLEIELRARVFSLHVSEL